MATLTIPILGSIRTIRDFVEGPSLLYPEIQDAIKYTLDSHGGVSLQRLWLENVTTTNLRFRPFQNASFTSSSDSRGQVRLSDKIVTFDAGEYLFSADMNYP
jgi:hypothetical protein